MQKRLKCVLRKTYYFLRPFMPRHLQIFVRGLYVRYRKKRVNASWPINPAAGEKPDNWCDWPDSKKFAVVLTHDVDTQKGHDKCRMLAELEKEQGFVSSFNFVPERYDIDIQLLMDIRLKGFEIGVHGLHHDGKLYSSESIFRERAARINHYIREWDAAGFRSPSMHHNLEWIHKLDIEYDASTFDTDPFEPQCDGVNTIFPFWVRNGSLESGFIELPYTLAQDWTLFILMQERSNEYWERKIDWIAEHGGMVLLNTHPDYMCFEKDKTPLGEYPSNYYLNILKYIREKYDGQYWHALPKDMAQYAKKHLLPALIEKNREWQYCERLQGCYALVTAARNEEKNIERTIQSVTAQTIKPCKWIIVSDGSTDRTNEIVESYCHKYDFIELLKSEGDEHRNFGSKARAVNAGYQQLTGMKFDYIGNLDADIGFAPDYYRSVIETFENNSKLGVSGGTRYDLFPDGFRKVKCSRSSVGGPFQMFRRKCFDSIGGYQTLSCGGIDAVAETMARMKGWQVESFPQIKVFHYRATGTAGTSLLKAHFKAGIRDYTIGYHPLFELIRTSAATFNKPYVLGGLLWFGGYTWAAVKGQPKQVDKDFVRYIRSEQMKRLHTPLNTFTERS